MIDFTNLPVRNKTYAGANGSKISVLYNDELYMLKFPAVPAINKQMSYANGCVSEYLGCHIFESIGIPVQKTLLGTYTKKGKQKIVVACKDFTAGGLVLQDFASLKNTIIDSAHNGYGMEKIYKIVEETPFISDLQKQFYKTMLRERKERILDFSYQKLRKRERSKSQ